MTHSSISILDAINGLKFLPPIKITFNGVVLYDDYDGDETKPLIEAIKERLQDFDKYVVTFMKLNVVSFHHSIVDMYGEINRMEKKDERRSL